MIYEVEVFKHRTETRLVVEMCQVTIEADDPADLAEAIREAYETGNLEAVVEDWEEVSTNDEGADEDESVHLGKYSEAPAGTEPDLVLNDPPTE